MPRHASLDPRLPPDLAALAADPHFALHDGRFHEVTVDTAVQTVIMAIDCGDLQSRLSTLVAPVQRSHGRARRSPAPGRSRRRGVPREPLAPTPDGHRNPRAGGPSPPGRGGTSFDSSSGRSTVSRSSSRGSLSPRFRCPPVGQRERAASASTGRDGRSLVHGACPE